MGHYMTKEERIILQTLLDEKKPVSYIARKLGCCRQTVYNEIRRGQYLHNYGYYDKLRYAHILPAVVVDADAGEVFAVTVAVRALRFLPWAVRQAEGFYHLLGRVVLACK